VAEKAETFVDDSGVSRTRFVPVATALPGEEIVYTITFSNVGAASAENVIITNPVPEHTRYLDRSATGAGTEISYSVDGGESYGSTQELFVRDNSGNQRPAEAQDYTHIRWALLADAVPGTEGFVRFTAVLD